MPLLKAIERGIGQTESPYESMGRCGVLDSFILNNQIRSVLESTAIEGDSPLEERLHEFREYPE